MASVDHVLVVPLSSLGRGTRWVGAAVSILHRVSCRVAVVIGALAISLSTSCADDSVSVKSTGVHNSVGHDNVEIESSEIPGAGDKLGGRETSDRQAALLKVKADGVPRDIASSLGVAGVAFDLIFEARANGVAYLSFMDARDPDGCVKDFMKFDVHPGVSKCVCSVVMRILGPGASPSWWLVLQQVDAGTVAQVCELELSGKLLPQDMDTSFKGRIVSPSSLEVFVRNRESVCWSYSWNGPGTAALATGLFLTRYRMIVSDRKDLIDLGLSNWPEPVWFLMVRLE